MEIKCFEIRDEGTCIPAIGIKMASKNLIEQAFLQRCGYPIDGTAVVLMQLSDQKASSDPYEWGGRTMPVAHNYIIENFTNLTNGQVIDVRVILKETATPAVAEVL